MTHDEPMSTERPSDRAPKRRGLDGRVIGGRYRVTRTVAAGANTLIAAAHDTQLDRAVTIKLVRPELSESEDFRRAFRRYMEQVADISHPNIAAVYDWGEERIGKRTTVFAVVEHLTGGSLRDLFDRGRNLAPSQALMIGLEACRGLDFAHRKGFVHTELTPSKLVFGDDRRLRIVDFGLARALGEQDWKDRSRLATHVARYASPEQALGEPLDGRTDVYSLALIMVEAVTGVVPFVGDSTVATLSARIGRLMPVSADLGALAAVLERAGRPEPTERASASQFGRALVRSAERLPRPTPIPILATSLFVDDPETMRRPNDPTGGITRPPDTPAPALVPDSATGSPVDTADQTAGVGKDATERMTRSELDQAIAGRSDSGRSAGTVAPGPSLDTVAPTGPDRTADQGGTGALGAPHVAAPAGSDAAVTATSDATSAGAAPVATGTAGADVHGELAALVERTPPKPAGVPAGPTGTPAARGSRVDAEPGAGNSDTAGLSRKERRHERKADKFEAKAARRAAKADRKASKGDDGDASDQVAHPPHNGPDAPRRRRRWVPWLAGVVVVAVLGAAGYLAWILLQTPTHEIPAVVGLPQEEAVDLVDDFQWDIGLAEGRSDEYSMPGEVISVSPSTGEDLAEGSPLLLTISVGPEFRQVPDLADTSLDAAVTEIESLQLVAGEPTEEFSETIPAGTVISGTVDGASVGGDVLPGARVDLVVSAGPQQRRVPQLRGLTVEQATQLLADLGLTIAVGETVFDDEIPADGIATQSPAVNGAIDRDSPVSVEVSKGPDLVTVPDLSGRTLPEIAAFLDEAGLELGAVLGSTQGTFFAASVDGDEVESGSEVRRGSSVNVIVLVQ